METAKPFAGIACPIHTSELIQRVDIDINASQQLYCMECILQKSDSNFDPSNLKSINDLLSLAANFYLLNKDKAQVTSEVPSDFGEPLSRQAESLEKLSKHIEEEKKKVEYAFDDLTKDFLRVISEKKNEFLYSLDQQLFNLRYWYIFFDKQVKKAYPTSEDISFLFPSKDELAKKLQKISNATQLMAFVRNIKEDLNEQKLTIKGDRRTYLNTLCKELGKIENIKPTFGHEDVDVLSIKAEMKKILEDSLDKLLVLKNPIKDVVKGKDYDSLIAKPEHFELLREWLPKEFKFNLKLLYRSSRDGLTGQTFHKNCDGKGATISLIKCQFTGSSKTSIIGGFLDQNWNTSSNYINATKAFIFSLSNRVKCPVTTQAYAGYGMQTQGPTFGAGHDIATIVSGNVSQNYVNPNSFSNTAKIVDVPTYGGAGQVFFKPLEIEVYSIN